MQMPESLGKYVVIKAYMDTNHARNMANRRSHLASSFVSTINLSSGTVNARTQLSIKALYQSLLPLVSLRRWLRTCGTS